MQSVGHPTHKSEVQGSIPSLATYFRFSFRFSRRAVVSYWRKYVHEVLVNRLGGLNLPRKSVVRLTDRPDMTLDVYRGRKTTNQQQQQQDYQVSICSLIPPATAISKTQDRLDTSVWWKLPFSTLFIIYYVQSAIINKVLVFCLSYYCALHLYEVS